MVIIMQEAKQRLEAFEMWIWRRLEKISYTEHKANKEVPTMVSERSVLNGNDYKKKEELNWLCLAWRRYDEGDYRRKV